MVVPRKVATLPRGKEKKLIKSISSLKSSAVLGWVKRLKKQYPLAEVYLVGGAVRDIILNISDIKDYDFVVRGISGKSLQEFLERSGWVELLGKNFGVYKFRPHNLPKDFEPLDVALPRSEISATPGSYRAFKVKFNKDLNLEQDLLRRDFTINAIALRVDDKFKMIDPFNGVDDIAKKNIRCVGKAQDRLAEDYTRILRAVRFACQLNFKIAPEVKKVIKKLAPYLNDRVKSATRHSKNKPGDWVSPREVIAKEFLKAFYFDHLQAIQLYDQLGLFKILMPEILNMKKCPQPKKYHTEGDVWTHTILALKNLESNKFKKFSAQVDKLLEIRNKKLEIGDLIKNRLELILAVLLHDIGKPPTLQTPRKDKTDRIRFNNHDNTGAELASKICKNLALSAPEKFGIDCENISWLVRKHMLLVHGHPDVLRPNTIEKYFFSDRYPGHNLIKLAWLDISATITQNGPLDHELVQALIKRIKKMRRLVVKKKSQQVLPEHLLTGDEIMQALKLKPGVQIGKIKDKLREKQLKGEIKNKKQALKFIKK